MYEEPKLWLIMFDAQDIVCASEWSDDNVDPDGWI